MVSAPSPTGRRQIVRKINQPSSLGSNQVSFNLSLMQMPIPDSDSSGRNQSNHLANSAKNHTKLLGSNPVFKNLGSFTKATLGMSRDNSEKKVLPNFMSRDNSTK
jgi:hypothetical protein